MDHELPDRRGPQYQKRKEAIPADFYHWIIAARNMVADNFPNELPAAHNSLIIETAKSMMMMHELSEIELSLNEVHATLNDNTGRE